MTTQPQPYGAPPPYQPVRQRPLGITILAILELLSGLFYVVIALGLFAIAALISNASIREQLGPNVPQWVIDSGPALFAVLGVVFAILAVVAFLLFWGFLKGKAWSRILVIIILVLGVIGTTAEAFVTGGVSIITLGISILIPVLILVYMYMPNVKTWFTQ